jgi:hypothetical protein
VPHPHAPAPARRLTPLFSDSAPGTTPRLTPRAASPNAQPSAQNKGVGATLGGLATGLGGTVAALGRGLGKTVDCTVGALLGSCARRGKQARGPSLAGGVSGLAGGLGGTLAGVGKGLGGTVDGTLSPLLGGGGGKTRRGEKAGGGGKGLAGSVEGLVGGLGATVTALGQGLAQTAEGTLAPVLGGAPAGKFGGAKAKARGKGKGDRAVAIIARRRAGPAPSPLPQNGLLGGLLNGLVGGLGGVVAGLGSGLGATLEGTLAPLVGAAAAPVPRKKSAPSSGASSSSSSAGRRMGPATVLTSRDAVRCRRYPDAVQAEPAVLPVYPLSTPLSIACWTPASLPGGSGRVDGDGVWLRTREGCFVGRAEVRQQHSNGEKDERDVREVVPRCAVQTPHWVGMLQGQYARADCYDCASLDCPSRNVGSPPFVDLECYAMGENVRDDRSVLNSSYPSALPALR